MMTIEKPRARKRYPDYSRLTEAQREAIAKINRIQVWPPEIEDMKQRIIRAYTINCHTAEPECLALLGPTGVGKTTLAYSIIGDQSPALTEEGLYVPFLYALVPAKPTLSDFLSALLEALGDPTPNSGTPGAQETRLIELIKDCDVKLLMLDEINHFVDRDKERVLVHVSNTLKNILKKSGVACLLIGVPSAEQVLDANPQLNRLFGKPMVMSHFQWDDKKYDGSTFRALIKKVEELLPLPSRNFLQSREAAWRLYCASDGKMAHMMRIIRGAAEKAVIYGEDSLSMELLSEAFHGWIGDNTALNPVDQDPFLGDLPTRPIEITPANQAAGKRRGRRKK